MKKGTKITRQQGNISQEMEQNIDDKKYYWSEI